MKMEAFRSIGIEVSPSLAARELSTDAKADFLRQLGKLEVVQRDARYGGTWYINGLPSISHDGLLTPLTQSAPSPERAIDEAFAQCTQGRPLLVLAGIGSTRTEVRWSGGGWQTLKGALPQDRMAPDIANTAGEVAARGIQALKASGGGATGSSGAAKNVAAAAGFRAPTRNSPLFAATLGLDIKPKPEPLTVEEKALALKRLGEISIRQRDDGRWFVSGLPDISRDFILTSATQSAPSPEKAIEEAFQQHAESRATLVLYAMGKDRTEVVWSGSDWTVLKGKL